MEYKLFLSIKGLPTTPNSGSHRTHWRVTRNESKGWIEAVVWEVCGKRPSEPLRRAHVILTRFSSSEPDYDNLAASFKPIVDGLVQGRILEDDSKENIGRPDYRWSQVPQKSGHVEILVKKLPDDFDHYEHEKTIRERFFYAIERTLHHEKNQDQKTIQDTQTLENNFKTQSQH